MWSLKTSPTRRGDDEGMILVWVGLSMAVLLGVGALTIDLGALYLEKRQLQNGADAAALAIAFNCAKGDSCGEVMSIASRLADDNAGYDHVSAVPLVCGVGPGLSAGGCSTPAGLDGATNWVQVFTSTESAGGGNQVPMLLAPLVGAVSGKTVKTDAIAQWGGLESAKGASPIVLPACEYLARGGALDGSSFPSGSTTIYFHNLGTDPLETGVKPGCTSTSGPDSYGWLNSSNCKPDLSAGAWFNADAGQLACPAVVARGIGRATTARICWSACTTKPRTPAAAGITSSVSSASRSRR